MASASPDIKQLLFSAMLQASPARPRNGFASGLFFLSIVFFLVAAGFLVTAGYGYMQEIYQPTAAKLYMGGILVMLALVANFIGYCALYLNQKQAITDQKVMVANIRETVDAVANELEEPVRENPEIATLLAGLAGYVAAQKLL